ncbi:MAG: SRPBCC domain-containing protein [Henriciella sp.]|uniref:SRPBCC domain-containing protein n=1 Tax=Henriciella sp. TaxID=1968823 RepID=UPI003C752419
MNEAAKAPAKAEDKQVYKVVIDAPIEVVWNTLVKTDEVLPFFFGAVCEAQTGTLAPGNRMRMVTPNRKYASVVGEVIEFSPPHRYAHTFKFTQWDDEFCTVTYDLKETAEGVEFSLTTTGVPADSKTAKSMAQGGPFITQNLKSLAETGKPKFSGKMVMWLGPLMGMMTPAACKIENWPLTRK